MTPFDDACPFDWAEFNVPAELVGHTKNESQAVSAKAANDAYIDGFLFDGCADLSDDLSFRLG